MHSVVQNTTKQHRLHNVHRRIEWHGGLVVGDGVDESPSGPEFPVQSAGDSKQMVFLKIFEVGHLVSETAIIKIL